MFDICRKSIPIGCGLFHYWEIGDRSRSVRPWGELRISDALRALNSSSRAFGPGGELS